MEREMEKESSVINQLLTILHHSRVPFMYPRHVSATLRISVALSEI